jgi:outer membrane protein assembly factor BamB
MKVTKRALVWGASALLMVAMFPMRSLGIWVNDGNPVCTATGDQLSPAMVSDGSGGAIVTWFDCLTESNCHIYAQRISASGAVQWTANGVALCTATGDQWHPEIVSDGAGGAIVAWEDQRNGPSWDIYAQRVGASGAVQWAANGVALCTAACEQYRVAMIPDGAGGAIVTWEDRRNGYNDIYAQRVSASGAVQWAANGVALCTAAWNQLVPTIVSDGAGGAIVTWQDCRSGIDNFDIYAQRVNALGLVQWAANGVALCTAAGDQNSPTVVSDGAGGAIVTWEDYRTGGGHEDIYAQRISAWGDVRWTADGVALCTAAYGRHSPTIVTDGVGGAIVAWADYRSGGDFHIYAQRVNASGTVQWATDGAALCAAADGQLRQKIVSDVAGGAIVTWEHYRNGGIDIYAQRVSASGAVQWARDGVALCIATGNQRNPTIFSDSVGGAIVTWEDYRSGSHADIYAQRVPVGVRGSSQASGLSETGSAQTLRLIWKRTTPWQWLRTPAIADTTFYLEIEHGKLSELSLRDGRILREVTLPEPDCERPIIDRGFLFMACSSSNGNVVAYDVRTLKLLWSTCVSPPSPLEGCGMSGSVSYDLSPPCVDRSHVYVCSADANVYCLDRATGDIEWKQPLQQHFSLAQPQIAKGCLLTAGHDAMLSAFNPATGELQWSVPLKEPLEYSGPQVLGTLAYVGGEGGLVTCVDLLTHTIRWQTRVGTRIRVPISVTKHLICAVDQGGIYGLDPMSGSLLWRRDVGGEGVIQAGGVVYCLCTDDNLVALNWRTGRTIATYHVGPGSIFSQPVVFSGRLLVAAQGAIYCFHALPPQSD